MKYLKTYKIFESITEKEIDDVALDIRDILLPLKHDGVDFKVEPFLLTHAKNIFIDVKIKSMDIKKYIDELRQLVSTLDEEGWSILNNRNLYRNLSSSFVVLTGEYDIKCPKCYSKNVDEIDNRDRVVSRRQPSHLIFSDLRIQTYGRCNNCNYESNHEEFRIYNIYFNNIDEMTEIVENRNIELINFRFYKV